MENYTIIILNNLQYKYSPSLWLKTCLKKKSELHTCNDEQLYLPADNKPYLPLITAVEVNKAVTAVLPVVRLLRCCD